MNFVVKSIYAFAVLSLLVGSFNNGQQDVVVAIKTFAEQPVNLSYSLHRQTGNFIGFRLLKGVAWSIISLYAGFISLNAFGLSVFFTMRGGIYALPIIIPYLVLPAILFSFICYKAYQCARYNFFSGGTHKKVNGDMVKSGYGMRRKKARI